MVIEVPTTTFTDFKVAIDLLPGRDKKITLKLLMDNISEIHEKNPIDMDSFRESRFSHGSNCPYCESVHIIKYGKKMTNNVTNVKIVIKHLWIVLNLSSQTPTFPLKNGCDLWSVWSLDSVFANVPKSLRCVLRQLFTCVIVF